MLSGQLGNLPGTTELAPGGMAGEARQAMENIKAILERNGSSMDKVVKCTVMLTDIAEWPTFNEVYVTYFPGPKPARSAFAAAGLAFGGKVEVECWASVTEPGRIRLHGGIGCAVRASSTVKARGKPMVP